MVLLVLAGSGVSETALMTGTAVSMVRLRAADVAELPAASVAVAVRLWPPSLRVVGAPVAVPAPPTVKLQLPLASAVTVPSTVVPSEMVTVAPASAVPLMVGVLSLVMPSPLAPLSLLVSSVAVGVAVLLSMVRLRAADVAELPAASVAVAVRLWPPSLRVVGAPVAVPAPPTVKLQLPLASAVTVPSTVVPSEMVTVAPASAVPLMVGVLSLVMPSPLAPLSLLVSSVAVGVAVLLSRMMLSEIAVDAVPPLSLPTASLNCT